MLVDVLFVACKTVSLSLRQFTIPLFRLYSVYIMTAPLSWGAAILISSKNNMAPSEAIKTDDRR